MSNKPTWKSRDIVEAFVENQGSNRKLHTIRKLGPTIEAPDLLKGFTSVGDIDYGKTKSLNLWMQAQKTGAPTDQTGNHTFRIVSGTESGQLLTSKNDTPFVGFAPRPYRSISRCLVLNTGSGDRQYLHLTSSQYITLASGTAGTKNKAMTWNFWIKPSFTGSHASSTNRVIFKKLSGSNSDGKREYELSIDEHARLEFKLYDESASKTVTKHTDLNISGSGIKTGAWQNICVTYKGLTGSNTHTSIKMYRNGILVSSASAGTTQSGYVATENSGGDLVIGNDSTGSIAAARFFRGKIAEFAMWDAHLTDEEVLAIYRGRVFKGRMDTSAIDHLRQGVSILTNKQRFRSSNAPKISGISRLAARERVTHEQDQTLYGNVKLFRDNTPFEELADAERLRSNISVTTVGTPASASLEFRGYPDAFDSASLVPALILTGANGTKKVFYFAKNTSLTSIAKYTASEFLPVVVSSSQMSLATGSIGQGALVAAAFTSRVNGVTSALQIKARHFGNIVKLTSTVTGTTGRTIISGRSITTNTSTTGSRLATSFDINNNPVLGTFITGTLNTASIGPTPGFDKTLTFVGGNSTMKQVVTSALGGAIDYLNDAGHQQYPVIITNVSMKDPAQFDGNIEPLALRETVSWSSIDAPMIAHDIRASFMGGEGSVIFGSSQISQLYDNKNPVTAASNVTSSPAGASAASKETEPFIDAQENLFGLPAKPAYAYLRFGKVPHNGDKIILTDSRGKAVAFEFANSTSFSTGTVGKLKNRPSKITGQSATNFPNGASGRGTWRVLLTASNGGASLSTGSMTKSAVNQAMHHFRTELHHAYNLGRLQISGSDRRYVEGTVTYAKSGSGGTFVRMDQKASGSDGNRRIDFRMRGFSTGTYIVNNVSASATYRSLASKFFNASQFQSPRQAIKFIRQKAYKLGIGFVSGSDSFNVPIPGFISEIEKKGEPFDDIMRLKQKGRPFNIKSAVARLYVAGYSGLDAGDGIVFTDTEGNIYSASIDASITAANSTARKIGYSGVGSVTALATSVYNSIYQAVTYGVSSTTKNSSSGNLLKVGVTLSSRTLFLTQSTPGPEGNGTITRNGISITIYDGHSNNTANEVSGFFNGTREIAGPDTILTSTMDGRREWDLRGNDYKSSGAGFTYDNDVFGTDSIAFGGRKR